jgi:hypothetical protein
MAKILVAGQVKNLLGVIVWSSKAGNMMYRAVCTGEWVLTWFKKGKKRNPHWGEVGYHLVFRGCTPATRFPLYIYGLAVSKSKGIITFVKNKSTAGLHHGDCPHDSFCIMGTVPVMQSGYGRRENSYPSAFRSFSIRSSASALLDDTACSRIIAPGCALVIT